MDYQKTAESASKWALLNDIHPAGNDNFKICLIAVDVQNTFCIPDFELFVQGKTGKGRRMIDELLSTFIYRHNVKGSLEALVEQGENAGPRR